MEIVLVWCPHAWQRGKVVNLFDIVERFAHYRRIKD
jgi:hypothetical protein